MMVSSIHGCLGNRFIFPVSSQVLAKHGHVLGRGLLVDTPTIQNILGGEIPLIKSANEQLFLFDFINSKVDTPGGRLAR